MEGDVQTGTSQTGVSCGCVTCPCANCVILEQIAGLPVTEIPFWPFEIVSSTRGKLKRALTRSPSSLFPVSHPLQISLRKLQKAFSCLPTNFVLNHISTSSLLLGILADVIRNFWP